MINITNELNKDNSYIGYFENEFTKNELSIMKDYCLNQNDYKSGTCGWGKSVPRLQKWYQINNIDFCTKWHNHFDRWKSHDWDEKIKNINSIVEKKVQNILDKKSIMFNSCLINYYRDQNDSIKPHFDSMDLFGERPTIAVISLGENRKINFYRRQYTLAHPKSLRLDKKNKHLNMELLLKDGSLLIMDNDTQKYYLHEISKESKPCNPRYSLTFRNFKIC